MKVYGWVPQTYGEWAYVMAESPEAAKTALRSAKHLQEEIDAAPEHEKWSLNYDNKKIDEFLQREPDEMFEENKPFFGEVC